MSYDDIINLQRPVSKKHKPMSLYNRAAQFSPFAALTGYDEVIAETGRLTKDRVFLSEDQMDDINRKLIYLQESKDLANFTYYVDDNYKDGGAYQSEIGSIKKIDLDRGQIVLDTAKRIDINNLVSIDCL